MTKILVDVDEAVMGLAASKLGTKTITDTIVRALELVAKDSDANKMRSDEWEWWADVGENPWLILASGRNPHQD